MRASFAAKVLRERLMELGVAPILRIDLKFVGPTLNNLRNNHWRNNHKLRNQMHQAIDDALQSSPSGRAAPETTMEPGPPPKGSLTG